MALEDLLNRDDVPEDVREAIEQEIARDQMEAAAMEPVEPLDWDVWGRWEPGY